MQKLRYFFYQITVILGVMVLAACGARQVNNPVTIDARPNPPSSCTPLATRPPKIDREVLTPLPTPSLTPTLDIKNYADTWERFYDHVYGISIEYPSIYREEPYQGICDSYETRDGIHFGENNKVFIRKRLGTSLDEHIKSFIPYYHPEEQFKLESQETMQVNNHPAIAIKYKLGDATDIRELVFVTVAESEIIYTFSFIGGSTCDMPEIGLSERTVFEHALETFFVEK
jgi:hypothetical protein